MINLFSQQLITLHQRLKPLLETSFKDVRKFGQKLDPVALIREANRLAGTHGIGRLDMIENRVVGIKSREIYETPGLLLLIQAHQELESLTLAADVLRSKRQLEMQWADLV